MCLYFVRVDPNTKPLLTDVGVSGAGELGACKLVTKTEMIMVQDSDGSTCVGSVPMKLSRCEGACDSYDKSPMRFKVPLQIIIIR